MKKKKRKKKQEKKIQSSQFFPSSERGKYCFEKVRKHSLNIFPCKQFSAHANNFYIRMYMCICMYR